VATPLKHKTQNALDEARTLILGVQIFVGALFRAVFEPGFRQMNTLSKNLLVWALGFFLLSMTLLVLPAPYHHLVVRNRETEEFNRFVVKVMFAALIPFALSLGISLYISTLIVSVPSLAVLVGVGITLVALFFWYGMGLVTPGTKSK
jgi:Family of unknown function (DUF6328)